MEGSTHHSRDKTKHVQANTAGLIKRGFDFELMRHLATSSKNFWKHVTMTLNKKGHSDVRRKPKLEAKYINTT